MFVLTRSGTTLSFASYASICLICCFSHQIHAESWPCRSQQVVRMSAAYPRARLEYHDLMSLFEFLDNGDLTKKAKKGGHGWP